MANVEGGGIFEFFKRAIFGEGRKEALKQAKQGGKAEIPKEKKKEREDRAGEILAEFKRVTPSHPAYEVLQGIELPDKKVIAEHPELGNLLLDIIHTINQDPSQYHNPKWLQDKMRRLNIFINTLGSSPEAGKIQSIEKKVENLYKKSQKDRREADVQDEIDKLEAGELKPEETNPSIGRRAKYEAPEESLSDLFERLPEDKDPSDPGSKSIKEVIKTAYAEATNTNIDGRAKTYAEQALAQSFVAASREYSRKVTPGDSRSIDNYKNLQKAFEKAGSEFLKTNPREGSRFMQEMREHGREFVEKKIQVDADYRNYWFYRILENVLYNHKIDSHRELYQLYESGEMHDFLEIVRRIKTEDGQRIGLKLADQYDVLKNTIFQSHDMDYYCAHPQQDMKEFIGSTSMFLNEYIDAATQDPMVSLAKRMYESALFHIRDSCGGYIPREWLAWQEGKVRASKLDDMVEGYLKQAIASGQLYDVKFDPITGLPSPSMWGRKQTDFDPEHPTPYTLKDLYGGESEFSEGWKRQLGELKIAAALKQAKGLALVDQRLLEIIGKSKGTGTKYEYEGKDWSAKAFNSVPYEGIVRYIDPVIHYYGRYSVGMDISNAFFNMIVSDSSKYNWTPKHMAILVPLYLNGEYDKAKEYAKANNLGDISTRLAAMDNPFGYSGMWGTMTKWRVGDATAGFDDWEKDQSYAAAVKLTNIGDVFSAPERNSSFQKWDNTWAYEKAKRYFIEVANNAEYERCRTEFRNYYKESDELRYREMAKNDEQKRGINSKDFDPDFEFLWRTQGERRYSETLNKIWKKQLDEHKKPKKGSDLLKLTKQLERAYKARVWVQTAMKAPLIIARELNVELTHGVDDKGVFQKGPLRKRIIWEILGINLDDLELHGGSSNLVPTAIQEAQFDRISDIEGMLASLQQAAIRANRDLTDQDFADAKRVLSQSGEEKQIQNLEYAQLYWQKVKKAIFGDKTAADYYDALGIKDADKNLPRGLRFHKINWDKIGKISLEHEGWKEDGEKYFVVDDFRTELLTNQLIDRNWRHLFSTEDMGWEFLNTNSLGSRNPVRRAGDLGSHVAFGQLFEQYLLDFVQRPVGKVEDMVEHLHKMFAAMSGDFQDIAAEACARVAYSTGMIYKQSDWVWKMPFGTGQIGSLFKATSISQEIHGRDRGIAWGPNDMLQWVQAVGSHILPKARYSKLSGEETMPNSEWDRARLSKFLGGTKTKATYEILNMVVFLATLITLYRSATAKSEEEEE